MSDFEGFGEAEPVAEIDGFGDPEIVKPAKQTQAPSVGEAALRGFGQGATAGWLDEVAGAWETLNTAVRRITRGTEGHPLADKYREFRDQWRAEDRKAKEVHPYAYGIGELGGGAATALVPVGGAAAAGKGLGAAVKASAKVGAVYGAAGGLGGSTADVTKGEVGKAAIDTATGAAFGGTVGAAAPIAMKAVGAGAAAASSYLQDLGQARLFKAAVGQTKRAYTQMNGKGLLDKAGQYLQDLGIGFWDSTESIAKKLAARKESLTTALTDTVEGLDTASGGAVKIDPNDVANEIESKVAGPLKKLAAARGEYAEVMDEVKAIRGIEASRYSPRNSFAIPDFEIESIDPKRLTPFNGIRKKDLLSDLTESMKRGGWQGRPVVAIDRGNGLEAVTGSHRIVAAKIAGIDEIPVVRINLRDDQALADKILSSRDDFELLDNIKLAQDKTATSLVQEEGPNFSSGISFSDAVAQRQAAQSQANYNVQQGRSIAAQARRDIANIWNEQIDKQAEPLLRQSGKAGDSYRELRHEYSLVKELLGHVNSRVQGNAANRFVSPSDYGLGGIAGVMTANPAIGLAAGVANHLGRVYGNAAAGRAAINMAKAAASSGRAAQAILPPLLRGIITNPPSPGDQNAP